MALFVSVWQGGNGDVALQDQGVEAAIALSRNLKRDAADHYEFTECDLLILGDKLLENAGSAPAIAILELSLEEFPESSLAYHTNFDLAQAYSFSGDRQVAIRYPRTASELNLGNERMAGFLEELETGA